MNGPRIVDMGIGATPVIPDGTNEYDETFEQAWARYRANHPEVVASWGQQNGRWPKCTCPPCDPEKRRLQPDIFVNKQDA